MQLHLLRRSLAKRKVSQDRKTCDGDLETVSHKSLLFVLLPLVVFTGCRIPVRMQSLDLLAV